MRNTITIAKIIILSFSIFSANEVFCKEKSNIIHRVYLTANTADISLSSPFISIVARLLGSSPGSFSLVLNGDLIPGNLSNKKTVNISKKLKTILQEWTPFENGNIIIIPGDRDWSDSGEDGLKNVKKLRQIIDSFGYKNVIWALKKGCPGPKLIQLTPQLSLVAINTQWWNHPFEKPGPADADCKISTTDDFKEELEDIIDDENGNNLIIAGHFPVRSLGEYGGNFSFKSHVFPFTEINDYLYLPLPLIGSFYPSYRKNVGTTKDISNELFDTFRNLLANIITYRQSLIYVSGHENNLQILRQGKNYLINSGCVEKIGYTATHADALYANSVPGIVELIYYDDGKIASRIHPFGDGNKTPCKLQFTLFRSACKDSSDTIPMNDSFIPCKKKNDIAPLSDREYPDSVEVIAGKEYAADALHRFFFGDHYRSSWIAPVMVPYLNLDDTFGGLVPLKRGGGRQTKSLKFLAGNGMRYAFRSVNKDPIKALDYELRETIVADVIRDQTSTQQPYGAMAVDIMLNELDVLHAHPILYVLPDDEKLGIYRTEYGNLLGMLEENPNNTYKGKEEFSGANEIVRSHKLFRRLYQDHDNRVDSKNFAIARCFDILVGDWSKHEDNWKWVGFKKDKKTYYKPMPRDRDHVFSRWDGLLPWIADREWVNPSGENFGYEIVGLRSLMWQPRHLDRLVAADLDKTDWIRAANYVQEKITDEVIEKAVRNMPPEIYHLSGEEIEKKLKRRILDLEKYTIEYYEMLALEVDIVGSNKEEYFNVIRKNDGTVQVSVTNIDDDKPPGDNIYFTRTFYPHETDEIRLYGLDGADVFNISGKSPESIRIRIIGGPGADQIYDSSSGDETLIYEKNKNARIQSGDYTVRITPHDKSLYNYNRTVFAYDTYFLLPYIAYNTDQQFIFNISVEFLTQRFGKKDYSSKHNIGVELSSAGTFSLAYNLRLHHLIDEWDLNCGGIYANPNDFLYFYGTGNETIKDQEQFDQDYYKTRYKSLSIWGGMIRDFWKRSSLKVHLHYNNNQSQMDTQDNILGDSTYFGGKNLNLAELDMRMDLDFRDDPNLPEDGMRLLLTHNNGFILTNDNSNYAKSLAFIEYFTSIHPITLGIKTGGGISYGKIPFYNQFSLGQNTYLRGFRRNRFTGEDMAFLNSELRLKLFNVATKLVPIKIGITGFFDTAKIFQSGEDSKKWHVGYGFGVYLVPLKSRFTLHLTAQFSEEESLLLAFGLGSSL